MIILIIIFKLIKDYSAFYRYECFQTVFSREAFDSQVGAKCVVFSIIIIIWQPVACMFKHRSFTKLCTFIPGTLSHWNLPLATFPKQLSPSNHPLATLLLSKTTATTIRLFSNCLQFCTLNAYEKKTNKNNI